MATGVRQKIVTGSQVKWVNGVFNEKAGFPFKPKDILLPKKGYFYIVREIVDCGEAGIGVRLKEISNKKFNFGNKNLEEPAFMLERFESAS